MMVLRPLQIVSLGLALFGVGACDNAPNGPPFVIVSGSENRSLEPIVMDYCASQRRTCEMRYEGSLDIGLSLADGSVEADAVWPANGMWIAIYDRERRVKHLQSISLSPVILGVRKSKVEALGWTGRDVSSADILEAVREGELRFLMTSATQSNSGAGAYLAMLSSALGHPDIITVADLEKTETADIVGDLLQGVERTAGSSGWLRDLYLETAADGIGYDAMWNYEAILAEVNAELARTGAEPLWAIYPSDGVAMADSPLGYVAKGQPAENEEFFLGLQAHLLSESVQQQLAGLGRRVALGRADTGQSDPTWNFDPSRLVTTIRMPEPAVVAAALNLFQEGLRRPSLTAYCLDFSGSMKGAGVSELKRAAGMVFTPEAASKVLIQATPRDRIVVLPFDGGTRKMLQGRGIAADQSSILAAIEREQAGGGTDMYRCASQALNFIAALDDREDYLAAIVVMTDGQSDQDTADAFFTYWDSVTPSVPVFGITFGDADRAQLDHLADYTRARVFDGRESLVDAFRAVRGYN